MKFGRSVGIILALACLQTVVAQSEPDSLWILRNNIPDTELYYFHCQTCDTPVLNTGCFNLCDTGDLLGSGDTQYINFDYQFTTAHPGYAGFKIFWDNGLVSYDVTNYDTMSFWHKGPLPGHKVHMIWGQGGECGGPINYQNFADYKSSTVWKKEVIAFPPGFVRKGIFELRMLIYNDSIGGDTTPTSPKGCLKVDNMCFVKNKNGVRDPKYIRRAISGPNLFVPTASGKATLTIYSLKGERLFKGLVDVAAGKSYIVSQFARNNSKLPAGQIQCVQISGPGVNITAKLHPLGM